MGGLPSGLTWHDLIVTRCQAMVNRRGRLALPAPRIRAGGPAPRPGPERGRGRPRAGRQPEHGVRVLTPGDGRAVAEPPGGLGDAVRFLAARIAFGRMSLLTRRVATPQGDKRARAATDFVRHRHRDNCLPRLSLPSPRAHWPVRLGRRIAGGRRRSGPTPAAPARRATARRSAAGSSGFRAASSRPRRRGSARGRAGG